VSDEAPLDDDLRVVADELRATIRNAYANGISIEEISRVAGISILEVQEVILDK
jgi:AraC-like DNA-binding protein